MIITEEAGDDPEEACVWNHDEFRLLGPALDPVSTPFDIGCGRLPSDGRSPSTTTAPAAESVRKCRGKPRTGWWRPSSPTPV
ncbi:hypothetical protein ACGF0D_39150 [Kitasatospora sp. NPDC048298]|uniref:hypothetical protein n=1 Tax=Kitasatospora sp. NPDC048298 TaxID=3364049 RepID=UPI00371C0ED5